MESSINPYHGEAGHLLHNLLLFGRLLRGLGLDVNPGRMITLVQALNHIDIGRKNDFYHTTRCLLVHRAEDLALFDQAFDLFWRKPGEQLIEVQLIKRRRPISSGKPEVITRPEPARSQTVSNEDIVDEEQPPMLDVNRTYSARELLKRKDFAQLSAEELEAIKKMMTQLIWHLGDRRTRRYQPGRGQYIDMRRSLRHSLRYGGELLEWSYRQPKIRPRPLVVIADISGSMERYTRLLLQFIYSLTKGLDQPVEAFVFSTRLTRITHQLRGRDVDQAMDEVSRIVLDWSGGTRIGEALKRFNYDWARRVLGRGAVVLMISDGWDRGDPILLANELARLQRSCFRLIWLNPLLGSPDYEPLTRGMQAALPFIDDFLPAHNLASLESLAGYLAKVETRRAVRKQQTGSSIPTGVWR